MWSDPDEIEGWMLGPRGVGWLFGGRATGEFSYYNGLKLVVRSHQLVEEGYQWWFKEKSLVTVWSAPNYCYRCGNRGVLMRVGEELGFEEVEADPRSV